MPRRCRVLEGKAEEIDPRVRRVVAEQPYPIVFATISGAHLYGFPSADSDWDLRGVHVLPARDVLGLESGPETEQDWAVRDGLEIDLVTHDAKKFFTLMLRRNGYVLEQLLSPLVLLTTPAHTELKAIAPGCITRGRAEHYLGFARNEWKLFTTKKRTVKKLLYLYRVLLTGIHLMRTHEVEANLERLNALYPQPSVPDLIALKCGGKEKAEIGDADLAFHERAYERLREELRLAGEQSGLPELPSARSAPNDLLLRLRLGEVDLTPSTPPLGDPTLTA